jgi:hypothetical protein
MHVSQDMVSMEESLLAALMEQRKVLSRQPIHSSCAKDCRKYSMNKSKAVGRSICPWLP